MASYFRTSIAYVVGVMLFHENPIQIAMVLGVVNTVAALLLLAGVLLQRRHPA